MKFEMIKDLEGEKFRRLTGVKRVVFNKMLIILKEANKIKKIKGGRENILLMTLEYIREYRTYFHIYSSYVDSGRI